MRYILVKNKNVSTSDICGDCCFHDKKDHGCNIWKYLKRNNTIGNCWDSVNMIYKRISIPLNTNIRLL